MVLESLTNPFKVKEKPWHLFYYGFIISTIALFFSVWIFEKEASLIMVFLTVFACIPFVIKVIKNEEIKTITIEKESTILKEHCKALIGLTILFLGITISFSIWYTLLPKEMVNNIFAVQIETIASINSNLSGNFFSNSSFGIIFMNNIKVLSFCILFSFLYGAGAIFILTWNASVIGTAIGSFARDLLVNTSTSLGFNSIANYFSALSLGLLRYLLHGIPEIFAYFVGGLAGGIISYAIINHNFQTKKFEKVLLDSSELIIASILLLVFAGLVEVYITPALF